MGEEACEIEMHQGAKLANAQLGATPEFKCKILQIAQAQLRLSRKEFALVSFMHSTKIL
ncbi:MAG TPA: hypothetical protein VFW25_10615 [Silvibacterium sp.]|nr:hypothetical protein [Silvibacterium sp.]